MGVIKIKNINSKAVPSYSAGLVSRLGFLVNVARIIPCYLVDPDLMDLIYPPEKRVVMDEEKIRENMKEYEIREDIDEIPIERILETSKKEVEIGEVMIAVGVYIHRDTDNRISSAISKTGNLSEIDFPAIFICPERVYEWSEEINISPEVLFAKVFYHELGHAYIYNPNKKGDIYKIIEESFCNAVAFSRFSQPEEIEMVIKAIDNQPFEYRGYTYFVDKPGPWFYYPYFLHPEEVWDLFYYLYRRKYLRYFPFFDVFRSLKSIWKKDINLPEIAKFYKHLAYFIIKEILGE